MILLHDPRFYQYFVIGVEFLIFLSQICVNEYCLTLWQPITRRNDWKRRSLPLNRGTVMGAGEDKVKFEDPEEHRKKLINEARILLVRFSLCLHCFSIR